MIALIIVFIIVASFILTSIDTGMKYGIRRGKVIILSFYDISRYLVSYDNVSIYILDSQSLKYAYEGEIIFIISHTAVLPNGKVLIALNQDPDLFSIYGINVSGHIYKAVLLNNLATIVSANKIVIIGCDLSREHVYEVFRTRTGILYYYRCPAILDLIVDDVKQIISGREPNDKCFSKIIYDKSI